MKSVLVTPALKASGDTVEQFIADRHAEEALEEQEYQDYLKGQQARRS